MACLNYLLMWQAGLLCLVPGWGRHLHHTALTASRGMGWRQLSWGRLLLRGLMGWHIGGHVSPLDTVVRWWFIVVVVDDRHTLEAEKTHHTWQWVCRHAHTCTHTCTHTHERHATYCVISQWLHPACFFQVHLTTEKQVKNAQITQISPTCMIYK